MRRSVLVRDVLIGGGAPVSVQSMTNTDTRNIDATVEQIKRLEDAGCDIVRFSVYDSECAQAVSSIKKRTRIPLVADIHFDYRLAIAAIESGIDKIRFHILTAFILSTLAYFCNLVCNVTVHSGTAMDVPLARLAVWYNTVPDFPRQFTDIRAEVNIFNRCPSDGVYIPIICRWGIGCIFTGKFIYGIRHTMHAPNDCRRKLAILN